MSRQRILQINFRTQLPRADYEQACGQAADAIAAVPGLLWKAWIFDEKTGRAGGIYLFDDEQALNAYVEGPIVAGLRDNSVFEDLSVRSYAVLAALSETTRFPLPAAALAG
jgi:hypothetical protein